MANTVILMFKWYESEPYVEQTTEILNYIFTAFFIIEAAIKLISIDLKIYFSEGWNVFDTVIITGSFASIFISADTTL